jgi:hypothetical protein
MTFHLFRMKTLVTSGWVLLALEVVFVGVLFATKNMGDDAAGRGMARGFALILAPVVLVAAGLLAWGTRGGPKAVLVIGLVMVFSPVLYGAVSMFSGTLTSISRTLGRAEYGRFDDGTLTKLARAITRADTATVEKLLAAGTPNWNARDRRGQTILGHAIVEAIKDYGGAERVVFVRMLLDAGAPATKGAIAAEVTMASVSEHNLVYHLYGVHNASAVAVLDMVLSAGLSPNEVDEDSVPIYFSTYTVLPALEVLAKHGASFTGLDPRTDRLHQNALMNAISMQMWDVATFFLEQGVSPDYVAPDGRSARTMLAELDGANAAYYGADAEHHAAFVAALARHVPAHADSVSRVRP